MKISVARNSRAGKNRCNRCRVRVLIRKDENDIKPSKLEVKENLLNYDIKYVDFN